MLTILFYSSNGPAAKARSRALAAVKGDYARVIDAGFWDGEPSKCDQVEIMPDVPKWQRKRIVATFGKKIVDPSAAVEQQEEPLEEEKKEVVTENGKKAVHRGGGRWFVMEGDNIISGPHDKAEAKRLMEA